MLSQVITSELLKEAPDLIDLIDRFISRLPKIREEIINAYDIKDWDGFIRLVHQMKGVGGNYGYHMFTDLCADIETLVKEEKYTVVKIKLDEFNIICEQILAGSEENHKIVEKSK
jgi:HPt (histidine-containing phosphotransfer) domain-containing protein